MKTDTSTATIFPAMKVARRTIWKHTHITRLKARTPMMETKDACSNLQQLAATKKKVAPIIIYLVAAIAILVVAAGGRSLLCRACAVHSTWYRMCSTDGYCIVGGAGVLFQA